MKLNAYVIFDSKAQIYNKPFFLINSSIALRSFQDITNDENTDIHNHPEDFSLWLIGEYEDATAVFTPCLADCLCKAHELTNLMPEEL